MTTSEPETAQDFYGQLFGWTYEVGGREYGRYIDCFARGSSVAGIVQNTPGSGYPDGWTTYLSSADAQATCALADDSGGETTMQPMVIEGMGTMSVVVDPGGATIGVWQPGDHPGYQILDETGTVVWHELHTRHYRASVAFYEYVFGWRTRVEGDTDEFRYAIAEFEGKALAGIWDATNFHPEDKPAVWHVYFGVDDVDATVALAESLGAKVLQPATDSGYGRTATIADPTGAVFKVLTPA